MTEEDLAWSLLTEWRPSPAEIARQAERVEELRKRGVIRSIRIRDDLWMAIALTAAFNMGWDEALKHDG